MAAADPRCDVGDDPQLLQLRLLPSPLLLLLFRRCIAPRRPARRLNCCLCCRCCLGRHHQDGILHSCLPYGRPASEKAAHLGLDEYRSVVFTAHRPEPLSEELPGNATTELRQGAEAAEYPAAAATATATATATESFTTTAAMTA